MGLKLSFLLPQNQSVVFYLFELTHVQTHVFNYAEVQLPCLALPHFTGAVVWVSFCTLVLVPQRTASLRRQTHPLWLGQARGFMVAIYGAMHSSVEMWLNITLLLCPKVFNSMKNCTQLSIPSWEDRRSSNSRLCHNTEALIFICPNSILCSKVLYHVAFSFFGTTLVTFHLQGAVGYILR